MTFEEAIKIGKVVVVAGAGISKDPPANLPSWWDYNIILLECIGLMGAQAIGSDKNLLDMEIVKKTIPVISVSEFFVDRIAGEYYYPLLSLLDGARPNAHHLMLARLFNTDMIRAIVTTNFDTLIEKAFEQENVSLSIYDLPDDYYQEKDGKSCSLFKIHGSASKPEFAIDTIHQKLKGLSIEKRYILQKLFAENHILFLGFSGEDFLFGTDYIPVRANKNNNLGITWIAYPGSIFNANTQNLVSELSIDVRYMKLPDFYANQGWALPEVNYSMGGINETFTDLAKTKIFSLLNAIGKWSCLGMCIELLELLGEQRSADEVVWKTNKCDKLDILEMPQKISLYSNLAVHAMSRNQPEEALNYCSRQIETFILLDKFYNENKEYMTSKTYRAMNLNKSTVENRIGMILLDSYKKYDVARRHFLSSFYLSYEAQSWENMAVSLSNIALVEFSVWRDEKGQSEPIQPHFIAIMEAAHHIAEYGGYSQILFDTSCLLVQMYAIFGQKKLVEMYLEKAEHIKELCINREKNNILLNEAKEIANLCTEMPSWPKDHMILCLPYETQFLWNPYSQRPVLAYEEGKVSKKLFEDGKITESIHYLLEIAEKYLDQKQYEKAEMFYDCLASIFLDAANKAGYFNDVETQNRNYQNGKMCYEKCLIAEFFMGRIDYLVGTLGSLSRLNNMVLDSVDKELALFQAELALCICNDPIECWQSVIAAETACCINLEKGRKMQAEKYCKMYLEMVKVAPWSADPNNIMKMEELLKECHSSI